MEGSFLTRIGIVDDHPVFRVGLNRSLEREPDMNVMWELGSVTELESTLQTNPVDVVLSVVDVPGGAQAPAPHGGDDPGALQSRRRVGDVDRHDRAV